MNSICVTSNVSAPKWTGKHLKTASAMQTLFTNKYQTCTPFKKKGGCITGTRLQKLMRIYTIFIVLLQWYIYSFINVYSLSSPKKKKKKMHTKAHI